MFKLRSDSKSDPSKVAKISIPINICNQNDYPRSYDLRLVNTSNSNEAVIIMNDVNLALFPFPSASIPVICFLRILKVKQKDPSTVDYKTIKLLLEPLKKKDTSVRNYINPSVSFGDGLFDLCAQDADLNNVSDTTGNMSANP